jgi:hypothetical protein
LRRELDRLAPKALVTVGAKARRMPWDQARPEGMPLGWKNFHDEDHLMLTPAQTMADDPKLVVITYQ